ncbi:DUF6325 family protein [Microbacterium sp. 3J1]|uniref:DUF6325 family protein n=1 Tax=Microbacterium sp. 3J1 TaxID=861269 RepID=UPI000AAE43F6|nr:DUF6325 family protein [Microbacterium sp. 3J1]
MTDFQYGPAEFYLVGFDGVVPDEGTFAALRDLIDSGTVRLLDFVVITKSEDGAVDIQAIDEQSATALEGVEVFASGLAGEEDILTLAANVPAGRSAAIVVLELTYARELARKLNSAGGEVLRTERIAAPVVNALMEILEQEGE